MQRNIEKSGSQGFRGWREQAPAADLHKHPTRGRCTSLFRIRFSKTNERVLVVGVRRK